MGPAGVLPTFDKTRAKLRGALRVDWPDDRRTVKDALRELPDSPDWPGLFSVLLESNGSQKRVAVVLDKDGPVAVVLLRPAGPSRWEPATQWIVPGFLFPVRPGCTHIALEALQLHINVGWWRNPEPLPSSPRIAGMQRRERHGIDLATDLDAHWKKSGNASLIRQAHKRCKNFILKIDPEGGAEWTIRNWGEKWRTDPGAPIPGLEDRVVAAKFLEQMGKHHTHVLFDGDRPIAGVTHVAYGDGIVAQVPYRSDEYSYHGVGTYTLEAVFRWAAASAHNTIDIGSGHGYKTLWAPVAGYTYEFTILPPFNRLRNYAGRLLTWAGRRNDR